MVIQIIQITQVQSFERLSFTHITVHAISRLQNKVTKVQINFYKKEEEENTDSRDLQPRTESREPSLISWLKP